MGKVKFKLRLLRFELQQKEERPISVQEVANTVGLKRVRLNKIELGMALRRGPLSQLVRLPPASPG